MTNPFSPRGGKVGFVLGVYPSTDRATQVEVWHSTANSTATTAWGKTRLVPSPLEAGIVHTVEVPLSTKYWYSKAKSVGIGLSDSTFTPTIRCKAQKLPAVLPTLPPFTGNVGAIEIPYNPMYLNAGQTIQVGAPSQVTPTTYLTKTITLHPSQFVPIVDGQTWSYTAAAVAAQSTNGASLMANVTLPPGVLVTSASARVFRTSTNDRWDLSFVRRTSADGTSLLLELRSTANATTGWYTAGAALSHTWTTNGYSIQADLNPFTVANDSRLGWVQLKYRMPTYAKAI